jgi:sigma-E factor negative regulatory protein RseC
MIDAEGTITSLEDGFAIVQMDEVGCGRCHEDGGCGGHNIGKMFCSTPRTFRVLNPAKATIGQRVRVTVPEGAVRRSAVYAYGFPLISLFAGAIFGSLLAGEIGAIFGALVCLLATWFALWRSQSTQQQDERFQPTIRS